VIVAVSVDVVVPPIQSEGEPPVHPLIAMQRLVFKTRKTEHEPENDEKQDAESDEPCARFASY